MGQGISRVFLIALFLVMSQVWGRSEAFNFDPHRSPLTRDFVIPVPSDVTGYKCNIILYSEIDKETIDASILIPNKIQSHGGSFTDLVSEGGVNHVQYAIDDKWIKLNWYVSNKLVAATLTALSEPVDVHRGVILYNPGNMDDQLSVGCSPVDKSIVN